VPAGGQTASDCGQLIDKLDRLSEDRRQSYLVRRLREGLSVVQRQGSAETLDEELKYQSELDEARAHGGLALVRVITWAIPILGFLGTVIGITMAIALLNPESLEQSLNYVVAALAVAFDTTAIALVFSMGLMFTSYVVEKSEARLLAAVDEKAMNELSTRFRLKRDAGDPQAAAVRRMSETVIEATEKLVNRQAELWQGTVEAAHEKWSHAVTSAHIAMETSLEHALAAALHKHAQQVAESGKALAEENHAHWARVQQALHQNLQAVGAQQQEMTRLATALTDAAGATAQVIKLEDSLNRNLEALAGAHHFEETLDSLAGVIHLLNARVSAQGIASPKAADKQVTPRAA
jgi:biopolymer transport protein ExbB/TolQ